MTHRDQLLDQPNFDLKRNEAYALKSEDFQSPTFYGEHEDGNVKCLNYKLTHYYRDSSANWLEKNNSS